MNGPPINLGRPDDGASERLFDLLVARSTTTLAPAERDELEALLRAADPAEVAAIEETITVLQRSFDDDASLGMSGSEEPLPSALRDRIVAIGPPSDAAKVRGSDGEDRDAVIARLRFVARLGWLAAAAAAAIAIAVGIALSRSGVVGPSRSSDPLELVDAAPDVVRYPFAPNDDSVQGVKGEVVWSDLLQRGYVVLSNLPKNDPAAKQYQLWVVDPARDEKPIDAGVFNVVGDTTTLAFSANLPVRTPAAFAVTRERSGGVVVTAGPILLLAPRPE
jgi:anti-sigma-K factor RskA